MIKVITFIIKLIVLLTIVNIACALLTLTSLILWDGKFIELSIDTINRVFKKQLI